MTFLTTTRITTSTYTLLNLIRLLTISALLMSLIAQFLILVSTLKQRYVDAEGGDGISTSGDGTYYSLTDLVTQAGGVAGFAVSYILSVIIIFLGLLSELPTPTSIDERVQAFWIRAFPSFGIESGKGVLGLLTLLISSFELAQDISGFPRVAIWFLFICGGIFNLLVGIALGSDIHHKRSLAYLRSSSTTSTDEESQSKNNSPPQLPHSSFSNSTNPRSPLPFSNNKFRFTIPSFRRTSVQSESIYSNDVYSQQQSQHHQQAQQSFHHLHQNTRNAGEVQGYMSEVGSERSSPLSMQQAFSARDFQSTGPMQQVRRRENEY